ncbi:L-pipecolate oxidase [Phytopseudomonas dryadis]|uniref:FAD-dependent oxidoreductase n=1 Tax=Phytopseudomonas dryadis TaxID=2487520 RepID=A0A4Q9QWH3_9GAMM|nr:MULTISPECIES: FAD-binding oxidoreductase [Pseudomonas]TBU88315.1 FAD-dependent oxidoreductase [Pseudomonas dryadis]TBV01770.1 FAD-dependent oxidoreductase [Pseudomonas dryadis]TBV14390.1 FAD-dependent oxidoreductase [Pseudomonas sp. FRB 230]
MGTVQQACLWETLTPEEPLCGALDGHAAVDVCVIGGGITGLSAALHLLEQGKTVCVLEAHAVGHGGSGRNVGLVNAGTWIKPDDVEATLGQPLGQRLNEVLGHAPAEVFSLIRRYAIDCQARNAGTLHMAHNAAGLADLRSRESQWQRRGADVELLTGAECATYCGTDRITGALLDRRAGTINPMAYTIGLAKVVTGLGGKVHQHSPVQTLQREGDGWQVRTAQGTVSAEKVVIATGAYTEGEWTQLRRSYFRGYYYQVASVPLSGAAADQVLPYGQGSWDTRTVLSSIRRDADGRLLLGSMGRANNKPAWFIRSWADRIQQHYFPALGKVDWQMHWTGCIDFTPDHLMRLFEPAPGIVAVTGYNGRGNTTGTVIGQAFARFLLRDEPDALPIPFTPMKSLRAAELRSCAYETGFSLYHAGQCLRVVL